MQPLVKIGHRPHAVNRRKYGQPYVALYWANRKVFSYPGLHLWMWKRNFRILPIPKARR